MKNDLAIWFVEDENRMVHMITDTKEAECLSIRTADVLEFADFNCEGGELAVYKRYVFDKADVTYYCESKKMDKGYNETARYNMEIEETV